MTTRRQFVLGAAAAAAVPAMWAQAPMTRPNLAAIDHERILAGARRALGRVDVAPDNVESLAYLNFTLDVPALAAASLLDPGQAKVYAQQAGGLLAGWLKMMNPAPKLASHEALLDRCLLAEVSMAVPFLQLAPEVLAQVREWCSAALAFLTEDRTALLARDARDRHGSSWLLQAAAFARLTRNEAVMAECRHRFKTVTVRAQIAASGFFPHELTTVNPFRNSLFNLDLLAGAAMLLSTRFESVWDHELQDGPGMRAAVARHVPYIQNRNTWPYPADQAHFKLLPCRRPALVFAARAYAQAEYAALWQTLEADPDDPDILRSFPIRQPIVWLSPVPVTQG